VLEVVDHIGIAVESLQEARKVFDKLFGEPSGFEEVAEQKVRVCFYDVGGVRVELLEPTSEDSAVAKFLAKRGQGVHHIAFGVRDIESALTTLAHQGVSLIDEKPREGAGGKLVAFLHPSSTGRVLIEVCQKE